MKSIFDSIYYNLGNFIYLGAQMLISIFLVRLGGFEDAGYFSLVMTINNVIVIISHFSMRTFQVSDLKNSYSDAVYMCSRIVTICVAAVVCILYSLLMGYAENLVVLIFVYALYKFIEAYSDVLGGMWQKNGNMKAVGLSLGIKGVLNFVSFLLVYVLTKELFPSMLVMMFSSLAVLFLFDFKKTKYYMQQRNAFKKDTLKQVPLLLKMGFLTMLATMLATVFNAIPKIVVEMFLDVESLGVFSSVAAPTVIISTFAVGLLLPIAPKMAENYDSRNIKKLIKLVCYCDLVIIGVGILATIFSAIAGEFVFELVFGKEILAYFKLFYYMIWVSVLIAIVNCYTTVLIAVRKLKVLLAFSATACVVVFALCLLLIGDKNIYGAGYAMLIALVIQFVTETIYIIYLLNRRKGKHNND